MANSKAQSTFKLFKSIPLIIFAIASLVLLIPSCNKKRGQYRLLKLGGSSTSYGPAQLKQAVLTA